MAHKKKQQNLFLNIISLVFALVGVGLLIGGLVFTVHSRQFRRTAVEVTGTIAEITSHRASNGDVRHSVQVNYSYNGQEFHNIPLGFYSSSMYVGKDVALLVDPENPGHMTSKSGDTFTSILFLAMGAMFALIGIIPQIVALISSRKRKHLMENGRQLHATVESIDFNSSVTYNGRHPYVIFCTYQDMGTGVTYRFKSKNLTREPGYAPGDAIEVFVDPQDYSRYVVVTDGSDNPKVIDYT